MIKLISCWICILLVVAGSFVSIAQPSNREIVDQSIQWFSTTANVKITPRTTIILEGQFRQARSFDPMQYQLRTGVDFTINKHFSFVPLGYVYTWNARYGKQPATFVNNEHRLWEQVMYKHHVGRFNISHRVRLEQRFMQKHSQTPEGYVINEGYDQYLNRARYRFMATVPFTGQKIEPKTYFGVVYDEAFLSWGKGVTFHEPDQNRLFAGVGYQVTKPLNIQAGLLYQMLIKANGTKQENNLGAQVMITYNISLMEQQ